MGEVDTKRDRGRVTLLNAKNEVKGCGFIATERHVITCTHVVRDCLPLDEGDPVERLKSDKIISFDFVRFNGSGGQEYRSLVSKPHMRFMPDVRTEEADICVLELPEGQSFPAGTNALRGRACRTGLQFVGTGRSEAQPDGYAIEGKVGDLSDRRYFVTAAYGNADLRIEAGASGGALFAKEVDGSASADVIGLVASYQQQTSGKMIPAQALHSVLHSWSMASSPAAEFKLVAPPPRFARSEIPNITRSLQGCDRVPQLRKFNTKFLSSSKDGVQAILCAIVGKEDDLPDLLQQRLCHVGFKSFFEKNGDESSKALTAIAGSIKQFSASELRSAVRLMFTDEVGVPPKTESIIAWIKQQNKPVVLHLFASAADLPHLKPAVVQGWEEVIEELVVANVQVPIAVFLVITAGETDNLKTISAQLAEIANTSSRFISLDPLCDIELADDIKPWATKTFGNILGQEDLATRIFDYVSERSRADGRTRFPLAALKKWLEDVQ